MPEPGDPKGGYGLLNRIRMPLSGGDSTPPEDETEDAGARGGLFRPKSRLAGATTQPAAGGLGSPRPPASATQGNPERFGAAPAPSPVDTWDEDPSEDLPRIRRPEAMAPSKAVAAGAQAANPVSSGAQSRLSGIKPKGPGAEEDTTAAMPRWKGAVPQGKGRPQEPRFKPLAPSTLQDAGLTQGAVEALIVKYLAASPGAAGRRVAYDLGLRSRVVRPLLLELKNRNIVVHKGHAGMGDFAFELSEVGRRLAQDLNNTSRYYGRAPVTLESYKQSVVSQSVSLERPKLRDLQRAFEGLLIDDGMFGRLGPAINAGRGCFMYGPPGNGKTSIAERITAAYQAPVFIPFAVDFGGQLVRVFDPAVHEPLSREETKAIVGEARMDGRWVLCKRPTIVVGGELTMDALELTYDDWSGTCEAPIQLKSNGGTLVIDDLGRQAMPPAALLNRWIVPMEKRVDYLRVPGGRKVEVPFDLMLVFSTNLEPRSLVDDAFLRRIPFKIEVHGPDEDTFTALARLLASAMGITLPEGAIDGLLERHFRAEDREMRMCHPRDLLVMVKNLCEFRELPLEATPALLDEAVELYFSAL